MVEKEAAKGQVQFVDPVHKMKIYEEVVEKEMRHFGKNRTKEYTINPFTMANISEKPNHITPANPTHLTKTDNLKDDVVDRAFRLNGMKRKIASANMQPRQKYPHAQTSNQEIGWYVNPLVPKNKQFEYSRTKCHITHFADEYTKCQHINPYKVKDR
eukprot:NODE_6039_length_535_cov_61.061728_g5287_i0.p1 GENE.NODE_6039_length_535_cov_61.061728_g5287_i0~~NODE_6039_length_535_cov_61.061728_g5287_i0.p1  ORF type:complete len:157 (-),score=38.32 NODE_6039_length_535_cov_61.061728_g5287_i0:25-495(-)